MAGDGGSGQTDGFGGPCEVLAFGNGDEDAEPVRRSWLFIRFYRIIYAILFDRIKQAAAALSGHGTPSHPRSSFQFSLRWLTPLLPGILLCAAVSCAAILAERFQVRLAGHAWLGDLVLAILIGTLLRSLVSLPAVASAGIKFSAKTLLEIAVALLGASLSLPSSKVPAVC